MKRLFVAIAMLLFVALNTTAQETNYAKSDFVPGDEIIFEDNFEMEKLGEFPLRWDLLDGYAETAKQKGRNVLAFTDNGLGQVMPLMKEKWDWLSEVFTVEFDLYVAPELSFEVQGHCDNTGSDNVNDPLSQKRAEAIVAALVKQGIAKERLTAVGKGSHSPIADNTTAEGRAKNRRVEFVKK